MQAQAYEGYFENGSFFAAGRTINIPERKRVFLAVFDDPVIADDSQMQARKELGEAFRAIQEDSVRNGTDKITMDEIDALIAECRQERRTKK